MDVRDAGSDHRSLLQAGLDHIDQGISVFDRHLRLVGWNRRFVELIDLPSEMVRVGAPFEDFIRYNAERGEYGPGAVDALVDDRVRAAQAFVRHRFERTRPNGITLAVEGRPLADGGFVTVYTDVTERRRAEAVIRRHSDELEARVGQRTAELQAVNEELRTSIARLEETTAALKTTEERLRLITDAIPASIAYIDKDMSVRFANRQFAGMFARTAREVVGRPVIEVLGPKLYSGLRPHVARAFSGRTTAFDYTYTTAGAEPLVTHNVLVPEMAEDGRAVGIFVLSLDITTAKKAEAALREAQKIAAIGQLAGGLAHDFDNLLTVVVGNLSSLKNEVDPDLAEEYIEPAIRASYRGVDLTRRLLAFARRQPLEPVAVDVGRIISRTAGLLSRSLPASIAITCAVNEGSWSALADPNQLENAIVNLALNARDAMPTGGLLALHVANRTLAGGAMFAGHPINGQYVQISVTDTGTGIDAPTLARAFEPFFTTKPFGVGSGLGLSMVYGFVKQSGGHIDITSEIGKGTCVSFLLPRTEAAAPDDSPPDEAPRPQAHGELVLLVEDNDDVRIVVRRELLGLGYNVIEAHDGVEAKGLLEAVQDLQVLVSDLAMPGGVSGKALAAMARRMRPGLKIVLISGFVDSLAGDPSPLDGVVFLRKPFDKVDLRRAIDGIERRAGAARA
jgi:PAS domain S-box-containing protein